MTTIEQILAVLEPLDKEAFDVHTIDDAWYSARALTRALTSNKELIEAHPSVKCVRVGLGGGMLELHPLEDGTIKVMCYCCFGGNPEKGIYALDELRMAIQSFEKHVCPPWPG